MMFLFFACATTPSDSADTADTSSDTADTGGTSADEGVWLTPGPEFSASWVGAQALTACTAAWQADAHLAAVWINFIYTGYAVAFSESAPDEVCEFRVDDAGTGVASITPAAQYAPGWTWTASDHIGGWQYDSPEAAADLGHDEASFYFSVNPAQHRAQTGWQSTLEGYADNVPVVLVGAGVSSLDGLFDGRTGAGIE